jgi:hypothetical protein
MIISPAFLTTRSLEAELAEAVNNFMASGFRLQKRESLKMCNHWLVCVGTVGNAVPTLYSLHMWDLQSHSVPTLVVPIVNKLAIEH